MLINSLNIFKLSVALRQITLKSDCMPLELKQKPISEFALI